MVGVLLDSRLDRRDGPSWYDRVEQSALLVPRDAAPASSFGQSSLPLDP